jgi:hypothetical protein
MKIRFIFLLITLTFLSGCPKKPDTPGSDLNNKKVWRIGLTKCEINKDPAESLISTALLNFGINLGLSYIKNAITDAGTDKEKIYNVFNSDYISQVDEHANNAMNHRRCIIIGSGITTSIQNYKTKLGDGQILNDVVDDISNADKSDKEFMSNDISQLGISSEIHFLIRIGFVHSADGIGVKPVVNYLYYPKNIFKRKNNQSILITVDGKVPNEDKSSKLSVSLKIPNITPSDKLLKSAELIHVENLAGWMLPPKEWKETIEKRDVKYTGLINLEAKVAVSSSGSKFWEKISKAISDKQLTSLGEAISKQIHTDSDELEKQKQTDILSYLDALAAYQTKNAALQNACDSADASQVDRVSAYYSAFATYKKAKQMFEAIKDNYGDEDIPEIGSGPLKNCPQ